MPATETLNRRVGDSLAGAAALPALEQLAAEVTMLRAELAKLKTDVLTVDRMNSSIAIAVDAEVTAQVAVVIARETATRFEKELHARMVAYLEKELPGKLREFSLVPLPDIQDAVKRCTQGVVQGWLAQLIGWEGITISRGQKP